MNKEQLKLDTVSVFDEIIGILHSVPDDAFNWVPFPGSWTIGQVAEHIIICSRGIPDSQLATTERAPDEHAPTLKEIFQNMEEKTEAAEAVTPGPPPHERKEVLERLKANKATMEDIIEHRDLSRLCMGMEFPYLGYMTRYEWLYFVQVHTQRHLHQIKHILQHLELSSLKQ